MIPRRAGAILDRDGTLIDVVRDADLGIVTTAFHPDQIRLLPGVIEGLRMLRDAGFRLAIATNQPGPAKGHFPADAVRRTNGTLVHMLETEGILIGQVATCLHHPVGAPHGDPDLIGPCTCRKPKPGLAQKILRDLELDANETWMIGDSEHDVICGHAANLRSALVLGPGRCDLCPLRPGPAHDAAPGSRLTAGHAPWSESPIPEIVGADLVEIARQITAR